MRKKLVFFFLSCSSIFNITPAFSQESPIPVDKVETIPSEESSGTTEKKEAAIQKEIDWMHAEAEPEVSIANRHDTPISKAPSIVTVITGDEIKNLGYRTFSEILRTIPGFEIIKDPFNGQIAPRVRGVGGGNRVRLMMNGHFVNNPLFGQMTDFDDFPVVNIKRLEIIRGPGSAMYGENAFLATINIITKDAQDIDGVKVGGGYGSFNTKEGNIVFGESCGGVDVSGIIHRRETDGFDGIVKSDYLNFLEKDNNLPPGSLGGLAPEKVEDWRRENDFYLNASYKDIFFQGFYRNKHLGPFIGSDLALNDDSDLELNYVFGEIGYKKTFEEKFTIKPRIYYDQFDINLFFERFPEGTFFNTYENGVKENYKFIEKVAGTEIPFDYQLFDGNILTLGFEYRLVNQANFRYLANFNPVTGEPLDSFQDFTDFKSRIYHEITRRIWAVYLQDQWDITDTLGLTLGIRRDEYSDFGGATSPRVGLTWAFMKDTSLKLLYGVAFRPPNLAEIQVFNPVPVDPETVRTYEVGLSHKFNKHISSSVNYFYNDIKDIIVSNQSGFINAGGAHIQGVETETRIDFYKNNYIFMNYTFQNPEDNHGNDLPFVAQHHGNFGVNVNYWEYINTNLSTFVSGSRSREEGDARNDLPSYALLNLSITGKGFLKTMEIQSTVFNLLDKDYSDPGPTVIPDDLPRPGRTFFVGLSYQF